MSRMLPRPQEEKSSKGRVESTSDIITTASQKGDVMGPVIGLGFHSADIRWNAVGFTASDHFKKKGCGRLATHRWEGPTG